MPNGLVTSLCVSIYQDILIMKMVISGTSLILHYITVCRQLEEELG